MISTTSTAPSWQQKTAPRAAGIATTSPHRIAATRIILAAQLVRMMTMSDFDAIECIVLIGFAATCFAFAAGVLG